MMKLSDQLRKAIDGSGKSRYRVGIETGISKTVISRFMNHQGFFSVESFDAIGRVLKLTISLPTTTTKSTTKTKSKGR